MNFFDYFIKNYVEHRYGATYIITELISLLSMTLIFNRLKYKDWKSWLRILIDVSCTWIVYLFLSCFFSFAFPSIGPNLRFVTWPLTSVLHAFYPRDMKRRSRVTCAFAITVFIELAISFSGSLGSLITELYGTPDSLLTDWTMYFVFVLLIAVSVMFGIFSPFRYRYVKIVPTILLNVIFSLTFILNVIEINVFPIENVESSTFVFISVMFMILLAINFISYIIFYLNAKAYNAVLDYQVKALKSESEKSQLEISNAKYEELHKLRHDLKNQMGLLSTLLREKKYDEMQSYLADINEGAYIVMDFFETGNTFVSAILNMELSKAKANGIRLEGKISIPKELSISSGDLNSLLCNAIDNAIEASVRYDVKDPIEVSLLFEDPYLFITVRNHLPSGLDTKEVVNLHSLKNDRMNHGYGTKVIKDVINRHHGSYKFEVVEGTFVFDGMLLLKDGKEKQV